MLDKQYIFFDLDGTLLDPFFGITKAVQYALKSFGIESELNDLKCFIGPPLKDSFMEFYGFDEVDAMKAVMKYRELYLETGIFENEVYEGIPMLLESLAKIGKKIVLATAKPTPSAEKILKHYNLMKYFTFVGGSTFDGSRYNKTDVLKYVIEQCKLKSLSDIIMIGDRKHDIIGAKNVGIDSIGVLYGYGNREELETVKADYIVETVADLNKLLLD